MIWTIWAHWKNLIRKCNIMGGNLTKGTSHDSSAWHAALEHKTPQTYTHSCGPLWNQIWLFVLNVTSVFTSFHQIVIWDELCNMIVGQNGVWTLRTRAVPLAGAPVPNKNSWGVYGKKRNKHTADFFGHFVYFDPTCGFKIHKCNIHV